jgi:phosphoglycerate dehydrogenase-like enzyme
MKLLIQGAKDITEVPGLVSLPDDVEVICAEDEEAFCKELPDAEVLLGWNFKGKDIEKYWDKAESLKWIHWCGAGVDAAMFDELQSSDVILSNSGGIFNRAMAETVLGYMLMVMKDFKTSLRHQSEKIWEYRGSRMIKSDKVLIVGVGSIGREFARLLNAVGCNCYGAGRQAREGDEDFHQIYQSTNLHEVIGEFDWVIGIMPSTADTVNFFDESVFSKMKPEAYFINMGRGNAVVEKDLISALNSSSIAGAMLDVFQTEPLDKTDPIWEVERLFITPHISGDYAGFQEDMVALFKSNLEKYMSGKPMVNVVDKQLGFVPSSH